MPPFLDAFLHLDRSLGLLIQQYGAWTYLVLFLIIFCETGLVVTPFLPGDSLLFAAGALAAHGALSIRWLCLLLVIAAVAGDTVNYWIGATLGPTVFHGHRRRFFNQDHLDRTHAFYERYGGKTIVLARFLPIVRTLAPFVAGVGRMTYRTFFVYNVLGGVLWIGLFVLGGYWFGNLPVVKEHFSLVIFAIIGFSVLPALIGMLRRRRRAA